LHQEWKINVDQFLGGGGSHYSNEGAGCTKGKRVIFANINKTSPCELQVTEL